MNNALLAAGGCAAARMPGLVGPWGAAVRGAALTPLAQEFAVFAAPRRTAAGLAVAVRPSGAHQNYQITTRVAASGGPSGSHPAWDPV